MRKVLSEISFKFMVLRGGLTAVAMASVARAKEESFERMDVARLSKPMVLQQQLCQTL